MCCRRSAQSSSSLESRAALSGSVSGGTTRFSPCERSRTHRRAFERNVSLATSPSICGNRRSALPAFARAIELAPAEERWRVHNDIARTFRRMGETNTEVEHLRASLDPAAGSARHARLPDRRRPRARVVRGSREPGRQRSRARRATSGIRRTSQARRQRGKGRRAARFGGRPHQSRQRTARAMKQRRVKPTPPRRPTPASSRRWLAPLVVALCTFVAFLPTLGNSWVTWDDDRNFLDNLQLSRARCANISAGCGRRSTWATTSRSRG